jgi:hypothetical protein
VPDQNEIMKQLGPGPAQMLASMQALQEKYAAMDQERSAERRAISEEIAREELDKAMANAASLTSQNIDPRAAAEVNARQRLAPIYAQWEVEDAALEREKKADMEKVMAEAGLMVPVPQ